MVFRFKKLAQESRNSKKRSKQERQKNLKLELLEERRLLAVGPQLLGIDHANGVLLQDGSSHQTAPGHLTFRFEEGQVLDASTLSGIRLVRSGTDYVFDDGDDIIVQPGFVGLGQNASEVIMRFSRTLPDDAYRITIFGVGGGALRNTDGFAFSDFTDDGVDNGANFNLHFNLALGAQIISVVPQPIVRDPLTGALTQSSKQIEVYFNNDELNVASVTNPSYYRLINTNNHAVLFPESVGFDTSKQLATLTFAEDLSMGTFHLQIGVSEEFNGSVDTATNLGTISQEAISATYSSPVQLDADGNPIARVIPDGTGGVVSIISVLDPTFISDLNVEVDIDHAWGPDLRVFLQGPGGQRVEMIRDLGSDVAGGQIYGVRFNDLDGDGVQDPNEPGLPGWTIFIDSNLNGKLDAGERSTVTDSAGRYTFVGLELDRTYSIGSQPQARWQTTLPVGGGEERLFLADFSEGSVQSIRFSGSPQQGNFRLGFDGRVTELIEFAGPADLETTASNIQVALAAIVDPGVTVTVVNVAPSPQTNSEFLVSFVRTGINTPLDHAILDVVVDNLNAGLVSVATVGAAEGFTSIGPNNLWNLSTNRGSDEGHTGLNSFYFGAGGGPTGGGTYVNNANGTLLSPIIDLTDPTIDGDVNLRFNHLLRTESGFDFATVNAVVGGVRTQLLRTSTSTAGFVPIQIDLTAFVGQRVQLEFTFTSDGSAIDEGWFVDDIQISATRGMQQVTLSTAPQGSVVKNINFGGTRGPLNGPDSFGYEAFRVDADFDDITETGNRVFEEFDGVAYVQRFGGTGTEQGSAITRDVAGNFYVTGMFQGSVTFGPGPGAATLNSVGNSDIFIAKLSDAGEVLWVRRAGGSQADAATAIAIDSAGSVYLTGSFQGTADFGPGSGALTSAGNTDAFILKLSSDGDFQWVKRLGGTGADGGTGIAIDSLGNVVSAGFFSGAVDMNPNAGLNNLTSAGNTDIYVSKLNDAGNFVWARRAGSNAADRAAGVAIDSADAIIVTGSFTGTVDFDPGAANTTTTSAGGADAFVWKLGSNGSFNWVNSFGNAANDRGSAVAVDNNRNVYFTGSVANGLHVASIDANGTVTWQNGFTSTGTNAGESIVVTPDQKVAVTGSFRGTIASLNTPLTSLGGTDIILLGMNTSGQVEFARRSGGTQDDSGFGLTYDNSQNLVFTGAFRGSASFDLSSDVVNSVAGGSSDAFVAKSLSVQSVDDETIHLTAADLNGFQFPFYGTTYGELFFSSNGLITFGSPNSSSTNTDLTDPPQQASIAAFWEDFVVGTSDINAVFWEVTGTGADQRLTLQWNNVVLKGPNGLSNLIANFQAILSADGTIQFNYVDVPGPQVVPASPEVPVGTFTKGEQVFSNVAADATGDYVAVWQSSTQDGEDTGVFAQRFDSAGNAIGNEFQVNVTTVGSQGLPRVAVNAAGDFVVVWSGNGIGDVDGIFARSYDASGAAISGEILVNATITGAQIRPDVEINDLGEFIVVWQGEGSQDVDGIAARRFSADGIPLDARDEVQEIEILGPPNQFTDFTLVHAGQVTGPIVYAGAGQALATASNIQASLRALTNTGTTLTVTPRTTSEVQTLLLTGNPTGGTFTLVFGAQVTGDITFAGAGQGATTANNIQTALRALPTVGNGLIVTSLSDFEFEVHFLGLTANTDVALIALGNNALLPDPATAGLTVTETIKGVAAADSNTFTVTFRGVDGNQNQPLLAHGNRAGGVTHTRITTVTEGTNGEYGINNFTTSTQTLARIERGTDGQHLVTWSSNLQDGSLLGVYAKQLDALGQPLPADVDEIQTISIDPASNPGSQFRLDFGGTVTNFIVYAGPNQGAATAANIQGTLQAVAPGVLVEAVPGDSIATQRITFSAATTDGTFRIAHAGLETADITFAGAANAAATATNIQNALNLLANLTASNVVVTPVGATPNGLVFDVVFANSIGIAQPLMFLTNTALLPAGSSLTITEITVGGLSDSIFEVTFAGASGRTDHPLMFEAGNNGGFLGLTVTETVAGSNSEFQVNSETINSQTAASSTKRADGSFVVTWQSQLQDGDGLGVFADIFDAAGNSLTGEFGVNTFTQSGQQAPVVAAASDGSFAIVWQSNLQDGAQQGVYVRLFSAEGTPLGDEFSVPELTAGSQTQPSLAALPGGNYVITWTTVAGTGGIHSRIIDSSGAFVNSESSASTFGFREQAAPSISQNAAGDYVVVWSDTLRDGTNLPDIYAQVFDSDGNARTGEILVNELQTRTQTSPEVAIDDAGNFVVTWETDVEVVVDGVTTVNRDVRARLFDISGLPLSSEILVNTETEGTQGSADVAINPATGEFIVAWEGGLDVFKVRAQRFDNQGNPQGTNFLLSATAAENVREDGSPEVSINAAGQVVFTWIETDLDTFDSAITYRLFDNAGNPLTDNLSPAEIPSDFDFSGGVAMASDGSFAMTWIAEDFNVYFRMFDAAGQPISSQTVVSEFTNVSDFPQISVSTTGEYTVVWTADPSAVFAQRFTPTGLAIGGNVQVNVPSPATTTSPVVSGSTPGEFTVGWLDTRTGRDSLFVRHMRVDTSSVGIKAAGLQLPNDNVLPIWVDGSATELVGAGVSTRIAPRIVAPERLFAVDADLNQIVELNPSTGAVLQSIPTPTTAGPDAGLAFANNTLYFLASADSTIYVIDPQDGAIIRAISLPDAAATSGLAYLDGHVIVQDSLSSELLFIQAATGEVVRRVAPAASIMGGLVGSGSRNTLFGINDQSELVELNPLDGAILQTLISPSAGLTGLAFVDGNLLVASDDGRIRRVDADNGAILEEFQLTANLVALGGDGAGGVQQAHVGNYQPLTGTILDDEGSVSITAGTGPYTGRFRPVESLEAFDQTNANGIWRLEVQDTQSGDTGVLNGWKLLINERQDTPPDVQYTGYIGDYVPAGVLAVNDVDIYRFDVLGPGTLTIQLSSIQGLDGAVRLFNGQGVQVASVNSGTAGEQESLTFEATAAGRYYVGISSAGNETYSALNGSGATGGSSTGTYEIMIDFSMPVDRSDDNSSFADATDIGTLGVAGQVIRAEIRSNPSTLPMPGGNDEPGHRQIPPETHLNASGAAPHFTPDRILLAFNSNATPAQRQQFLAARGLTVVKSFNYNDTLVVATTPGADLAAQVRDLNASSLVEYAELDERLQATALFPNDTSISDLWGMHNVGQAGGTIDADIDAPEAWELYTGSSEVVIAVIDSGIDYTHPDLIDNLWINPGEIPGNSIDDDGNGYIDDIFGIDTINGDSDPMDGDSHGTHVAGTIAAVGNNGTGVAGVNWNAQIMSLKFLADDGFGSTAAAIEAIDYMVTMKTQFGINLVVSNNSWGGGAFSQALQDAIGSSINAGILFVAAAGNFAINNDIDPFFPASYPLEGIISVAATDRNDQLAGFSHFGQTSVDIAAPGVAILSTVPGGGFELFDGTSMASPHVAGVAALLAGYQPAASVLDLKQAILAGADILPNLNGTSVTGGRLNAAQSMALVGASNSGPLGRSTTTAFYNFQDFYGVLPSGDVPSNAITENQKARAREIFELYGYFLGIEFIETADQGLTVITGDMRAMDPTITVGPGGVAGLSEGSLTGRVIMDAAENWGDSEYGGGWFEVAMHEIGHSMGLGHTYDLPNLTVMGGFGTGERVFPGDHDLIHGRVLFPNDSNDIDLYQFSVTDDGWFSAETIAERLQPNASLANTAISLYRESTVDGVTTRQIIARNDDYFSNDSYMRLRLQPGNYFIGVTSTGIENVDPVIANTGFGGTTEGTYELKLEFEPDPVGSIRDAQGVALDGNADGTPGGVFDFWFESGPSIIVDKLHNPTPGVDGDGSLASPFDNIQSAIEAARTTLVIPITGADIEDGESFVITDGLNAPVTFEFNSTGTVRPNSVAINFSATDSRDVIADAVVAAIAELQLSNPVRLSVTASAANGLIRLTGAASLDVSGSPALLSSPNIVRIVGNGGEDGLTSTLADNVPYLVGVDVNGNPLSDGATLEVPQGVTLMIDGGTLIKLRTANIDVGSSSLVTDRRHGALQVLGTPDDIVSFYSYRDDSVGGDSDGPSLGSQGGDWGGLVMRADSDMEENGVFLNWVNHADLVQGGGKLTVGSVEEQFTPVYLVGARPSVSFTTIRESADAAISADPRSFEDTIDRSGPKIHSNLIEDNTINGLFVRIRTELGKAIDTFDLPSRWSNTEIVHVVTENLLISATAGGPEIDPQTGLINARLDGRLAIDPGVVVKLGGARIEAQLGAQLIAEGSLEKPIIFTSISDDSYGGSGTFDTTNDLGSTTTAPGQWGGLFFGATAKGSIDYATIKFAGGLTPIEGNFDFFNPIEIHQADVRIANSLLMNNANGSANGARNGRGTNASATIFVRGAQPIIVDNTIRDNAGTVININANSLQATRQSDYGRTTGPLNEYREFVDNRGPLVRANRLQNNGVNGMEIRGAVLTTESVWDDTDIVHVLRSEITILNHHTFSGLRLQSSENESLVIKLAGANAGFTANGTLLDINDRIGGSLYVVAAPGRPVLFTSLTDDTATAGFDINGQPVGDTNNNGPSTGSAGQWRSLLLNHLSNDRNVELVLELEPAFSGTTEQNGSPANAQFLGNLAPNEKSGDINRRLGFEIHGNVSVDRPSDADVYSFIGVAGTEVWFDIDRTNAGLDTVLELINENGGLLARSTGSRSDDLSGTAMSLTKDAYLGGDFYTTNPRDAGMRVILPGVQGQSSTYFVRVRSKPAEDQLDNIAAGLTRGEYQLQIRLRQVDEKPGSTIRGADIRYATTGIEVIGLPAHSPLISESTESANANESLGTAQALGNLLTTDRNVLGVGGNLSTSTDVDWYSFSLDYDLIQAIGGASATGNTWSTIFDIDYADGIARPDTVLSVFDAAGNLILVSRDSNVADDQPGVGQGLDTDDLSRGSFGTLDPFIGSAQMPAGSVALNPNTPTTYFVAVSSNSQLPAALNATFTATANNPMIRLEPVNSSVRVAEDHVGFSGYATNVPPNLTAVNPTTPLFDVRTAVSLSTNVLPFTLGDVVLYVGNPGTNGLRTVNPSTGAIVTNVGNLPNVNTFTGDLVMRSDGRMFMVEGIFGPGNAGDNTAGRLVEIDPNTGAQTVVGNDNIPDFDPATDPPNPQQLTSNNINSLAFLRTSDVPEYDLYYAVENIRTGGNTITTGSTLYRANPANGSAAVADGQPWGLRGGIFEATPGDVGRTTGMAFLNGQLFGVSDTGRFYTINIGSGRASNVVNVGGSFAGLALGPQSVEGGAFANLLFAISSTGALQALNTNGVLQPVFSGGATSANTGSPATGLAFSPLDFNLWHPTLQRRADAGHGINPSFDLSRGPANVQRTINGRDVTELEGGASFYFGLETWVEDPSENNYFTYGPNAQLGIASQNLHQDLTSNPNIGGNYNLPGGATGSLATNSFSLSGSSFADKPTLYFNYFLHTENAESDTNEMRDSARVQISNDGGATWFLLATNNSVLSTAGTMAELPRFVSPSVNASTHSQQRVQELFDNTGQWRQARVDLSEFAGMADLLVRFDFATSGSMNQGLQSDAFGNFTNREKALNNAFEGFYVDDVIIGFAERGEMVTGATAQSAFFTIPQNPNANDPRQVLVGDYQLEIRRGTEYATTVTNAGDLAIVQLFNTNDRMIPSLRRLGDVNAVREQGQVLIAGNSIQHTSVAGILVDAGVRGVNNNLPRPGSAIRTPTLNTQRLVPGVHLENNVVTEFGQAGIIFSGDNVLNSPLASVPFGRIINNTIYGNDTATGTGILVRNNASPTILNNVVANAVTGISVDATSVSTVIGANLFKGNTANGTIGENAILLQASDPLFVNPEAGNFYLALGSRAIDSSINALADRPTFEAIKAPLGIPTSPILAPDRDRYNQLRLDDPSQDPPPGLGSNIFKDRGAIERADFIGPFARLVNPVDNDALGIDLDPVENHVLLNQPILSRIVIQLVDPGIGVDDTTVTANTVSVTLDGVTLVSGVDYDFSYNVTNNLIILTSLANNGPVNSTYVVTLDNSTATGIKDEATNALARNEPTGLTRFTIETDVIDIIDNLPDFQFSTTELTVLEDNETELGIDRTEVADFVTDIVIPGSDGSNVIFFTTLSFSNPEMFEEAPAIDANGMLTFKTAADRNGTSVVVVQLADAGLGGTANPTFSVPKTFTINLTPVNDAPEYTVNDIAVDEDQGLVALVGYASQIFPGPVTAVDEANQNLTFVVAAVDPSSFVVQPTISPTGTLQFQTVTDLNSDIANFDITVYLVDDGSDIPTNVNRSETQTFSINVNPINDSPTYTLAVSNVQVIEEVEDFENIDQVSVPGVVADGAPGPITAIDEVGQLLNYQVVSVSAPQLFEVQPTLSASGELTFRTAANQNGTALVEIQLFDDGASAPAPNSNASLPQTLTITITPINDAPEFAITGDSTTLEDAGVVSIPQYATNIRRGPVNAPDESGQAVNFVVTPLDPTAFEIAPSISPTGTLTFKTAANANSLNADLRIAISLRDSGASTPPPNVNQSATITTTLNIVPVNDPPVLSSFTAQVTEDTPITILASTVLGNARPGPTVDEDSQSMSITLMELVTGSGGFITPVFTGTSITSFTYAPGPDFVGTDTLLYVVTDNGNPTRSATGTITLDITSVNDAPTFAAGPSQNIAEDAAAVEIENWATNILQGPVNAADELANQTLSFDVVTDRPELFEQLPTVSSDGTLAFTAAADANGVATVTVTAVDSGSGDSPNVNRSTTQTFTISIAPVNDAPAFTPGAHVTVNEDSGAYAQPWATAIAPATGMLLTPPQALDESGQTVSFELVVSQPGLFSQQPTISAAGQLTFATAANAHGVSTVVVTAVDTGPTGGANVNRSLATTLTITLASVNDQPVAANNSYTIGENSVLSVASPGLLLNDSDVDLPNDVIRVVDGIVQSALGAQVTLNADGSFSYDPRQVAIINELTVGQNISDTFTYGIQDQSGALSELATVTISVSGVDDPPLAEDDNFVVSTGTARILNVLSNDAEIDTPIDASTVTISQQPIFGSVVVNAGGTVTYTPGPGFRGTDSFGYRVRDIGGNLSNEATVSIAVNSPPVANNDTVFTFKDTPVDIDVLANDTDPDSSIDPSSVEIVVSPSVGGTATVLENGRIRFVPATGFAGQVQLSYVVSDVDGTISNTANVSIRIQNSKWQNPSGSLDVNADGFVSPIDILLIINYLNSGQPTFLPNANVAPPPYLDPSGDERVSALDIILIINYLNERNASAEGEGLGAGEGEAATVTYAMMVTPTQRAETMRTSMARQVNSLVDDSLISTLSETAASATTSSQSAAALYVGEERDDEDEDLFDMLTSDADEWHRQSLRSAVDSFFDEIGPKRPK